MPKINLSTCKSATYEGHGKSRYVVWDENLKGFGLWVYPTGRKAFILSYRFAGRKKLYTIGEYEILTPQQARQEAQRLLTMVGQGVDPKDRRRKSRESRIVTSELVRLYLERHAPMKKTGQQVFGPTQEDVRSGSGLGARVGGPSQPLHPDQTI